MILKLGGFKVVQIETSPGEVHLKLGEECIEGKSLEKAIGYAYDYEGTVRIATFLLQAAEKIKRG